MNKNLFAGIAIALALVFVLVVFGTNAPLALAQATDTPTPTNTPTNTPTPTVTPFPVSRVGAVGGTWLCRVNTIDCIQSRNGGGIHFYGSNGALTFSVSAANGNIVTTGRLAQGPQGIKCVNGQQTVLGAATAIPATLTAAGIATPVFAQAEFNADPGNTYWTHSHTNSSGVVTFKVWQNMLSGTVTPQAATTGVAMDYTVCGN